MRAQLETRRAAMDVEMRAHRSTAILRNPRIVVPPSQRIPNWRALPVQGAGKRRASALETACNAVIVGFALLIAVLCAAKGWSW
jgi:hypothetical protein